MRELKVIVRNPTGLHARPATVFAGTAKKFQSKIHVRHGVREANAKRPLSLLALGVRTGGQMHVRIEGADEEQACAALIQLTGDNWEGDDWEGKDAREEIPPSAPLLDHAVWSERALRGIAVSPGLVVGSIFRLCTSIARPAQAMEAVIEHARLTAAIESVRSEIEGLRARVHARGGPGSASIFDMHLGVIDDAELLRHVRSSIEAGRSAAAAWNDAIARETATVAAVDDSLLASRAADVLDAGAMVGRRLSHADQAVEYPKVPHIVLADDLTASDVGRMDPTFTVGFCTSRGGPQSHAAILARCIGIPGVVSVGELPPDGTYADLCILDGDAGTLCIDADSAMLARAREEQNRRAARRASRPRHDATPAVTSDGRQVGVLANVAGLAEIGKALDAGADGVGLLRTEFLFLNRTEPPGEQEQFEAFREMALALTGRPFTVRTLDLGADKPAPFLTMQREHNPALGLRGIRLTLAHPELLETQLRALARAATWGPMRVMFPMIATIDEWRAAGEALVEARAAGGGPPIPSGLMIEVPAAALLAERFAVDADFISIGTNDLTQYALAIDREHPTLATGADGLHPAVLRLIATIVAAAHGAGRRVSVCGELACDTHAVPILVGLGVDELSVGGAVVGAVKSRIRTLSFSVAEHLARCALDCESASEVRLLEREELGS